MSGRERWYDERLGCWRGSGRKKIIEGDTGRWRGKHRDPQKLMLRLQMDELYVKKKYKGKSCSLCGWDKSTCDIHRIIPGIKGGRYEDNNIIVLCPNCHRLVHHKKIKLCQNILLPVTPIS